MDLNVYFFFWELSWMFKLSTIMNLEYYVPAYNILGLSLCWRFSNVIDRTVNLAPQMKGIYQDQGWNYNQHEEIKRFYVKTQIEENHGEEREFTMFFRIRSELCRVFL